jgi:hypothetical protein
MADVTVVIVIRETGTDRRVRREWVDNGQSTPMMRRAGQEQLRSGIA